MKASKIIFLLLIFTLGGCRTTYNYYLIIPEREEKPAEVKYHYPHIDRWNPVEANEMLNKIKIEP